MFNNRKIKELQDCIEELEKELADRTKEMDELKESVRKNVNAIHLYAALSEEETQIQTLKEKQREIMGICEQMIG